MKKEINKIELSPKKLFLIDGLGAILSSFLLGIVLVKFERHFGIPSSMLYILAVIPIFFVLYDFYAYRKDTKSHSLLLKGIACMNLLYCALSIVFAIYHHQEIKILGWTYIVLEILIISTLAFLELRTAKQPESKTSTN